MSELEMIVALTHAYQNHHRLAMHKNINAVVPPWRWRSKRRTSSRAWPRSETPGTNKKGSEWDQNEFFSYLKKKNRKKRHISDTCPPAAPMLPVPSTMPVTVARASCLPLSASCLPRSAEMAELIMDDGPPMKKPVVASRTAFMAWSLGEPGGVMGVGVDKVTLTDILINK